MRQSQQTVEYQQPYRAHESDALLAEHIAAVEQVIRRDEQRLKENETNESLSEFIENTKDYLSTLIQQKQKNSRKKSMR